MRGMAREYAAGNSLGPGWRESAGIFGCPVGGSPTVPSGREWNGSQPGQGAAELLSPRPAIRKMQGQPACRAGEPSGQGEEPPPEGLGGGYPLSQTDPRRPAGQVVGHRLDGQPGAVGGEAACPNFWDHLSSKGTLKPWRTPSRNMSSSTDTGQAPSAAHRPRTMRSVLRCSLAL